MINDIETVLNINIILDTSKAHKKPTIHYTYICPKHTNTLKLHFQSKNRCGVYLFLQGNGLK
jgi:hypothetical protein